MVLGLLGSPYTPYSIYLRGTIGFKNGNVQMDCRGDLSQITWRMSLSRERSGKEFQVSGCQNYGPFLGTLNIRCRIIIGTQKGTIILTTTQVPHDRGVGSG